MISARAPSRFSWASGRIGAGSRVPMPVSVTTPMTMPTQAAAATSGTPPAEALRKTASSRAGVTRVSARACDSSSTASMPRLTARKTV